jgi:hypothetical protein
VTGQQTVIGDVAGASVNLRITFIMPEMPASRNPPNRASNCIPLGELLADADHRGLDEGVHIKILTWPEKHMELTQTSTFTFRNSRMSTNPFKTSSKAGYGP